MGKVVSNKMQKSIVVLVDRFAQHPKYPRIVRTTKKFMAHDETNDCNIGDEVRLVYTLLPCTPTSEPAGLVIHTQSVYDMRTSAP